MKSLAWPTAIPTIFLIMLSACAPAPAPTRESVETATGTPTTAPVPEGKHVIGYYPSWAAGRNVFVSDLPAALLTHINYAFSNVSPNGECILGDRSADTERSYSASASVTGQDDSKSADFHGNFNQLRDLKQQYPYLKALIAIGGWSWSENFSAAAQHEASRQRFAASCIDLYLKQYPGVFDGLDLDWEYPVSGGLKPGKPEDKENFTLLLEELRRQLDELGAQDQRHYLLTIAGPVGAGNIRNIDAEAIASSVDWINLMGYDFHGSWDTSTNFNAPLFRASADPADAALNIDAAVQTYLSAGVPAQKLVLGVPFYGRGWAGVSDTDNGLYQPAAGPAPGTREAGSFEYKDLKGHYLPAFERFWDEETFVPWLYDADRQIFISYDDAESLQAKAGYARDQGLAGVMIWELSQGDESLVDAIHAGLAAGGPPRPTPAPTVMVPRPFEHQIHAVSSITVDGKLDDWAGTPDFVLDKESQLVYQANPNSWTGPEDLSAQAWVGWTSEGLFFAFDVLDDVHVQTEAGSDLWHGDHMELQFDTLVEQDYTNPGMNDDDYQIGISLGDFDQVPPVAYSWFNGPEAPGPVEAIEMANTVSDEGYVLEVFIPKEALAGITLAEGAVFGMNISPSDSDRTPQGQEVMLSTSSIRTYADPRTFGQITLVK